GTMVATLSPLGTLWIKVTARGDSAARTAVARTVPLASSPSASTRTRNSCPAPSVASTTSPGPRRRTRARCRVSSRSNVTRSPWRRSGPMVNRCTSVPLQDERRPALERDRVPAHETVAGHLAATLIGLGIEEAAEDEGPGQRDGARVHRREATVRGREEIGDHEVGGLEIDGARVADATRHTAIEAVSGDVLQRRRD